LLCRVGDDFVHKKVGKFQVDEVLIRPRGGLPLPRTPMTWPLEEEDGVLKTGSEEGSGSSVCEQHA
jgi:hypothetical protein